MFWQNLKLRNKLILVFMAIILIPMLVTMVITTNIIQEKLELSLREKVAHMAKVLTITLDDYKQQTRNYVDMLQGNKAISEALYYAFLTEDNKPLVEQITQIYKTLKVDLLKVVSKDGVVLFRAHQPEFFGDKLQSREIELALNKQHVQSITTLTQGVAFSSVGPINFGEEVEEVIGCIMVGYLINDNWAKKIAAHYKVNLAVVIGGELVAQSFEDRLRLVSCNIIYFAYK